MSYFKILRWMGGEGGDALLTSILLSHPGMISNVSSRNQTNSTARAIVDINELMPINVIRMSNNIREVDYQQLLVEIDQLRSQGIPTILKSHLIEKTLPDCIDLIPSENTMDFFFSSRIRKLGIKSMINDVDDFKLLKTDKDAFLAKNKNIFIKGWEFLSERETRDLLLIDDILRLDYEKMQDRLGLEINPTGRSFLENWVRQQLDTFSRELSSFR